MTKLYFDREVGYSSIFGGILTIALTVLWATISIILLSNCVNKETLIITESRVRFQQWEYADKTIGTLIDKGLQIPVFSIKISKEEVLSNSLLTNNWTMLNEASLD